jgi:hypothetical protein
MAGLSVSLPAAMICSGSCHDGDENHQHSLRAQPKNKGLPIISMDVI